MSKKVVLFGAGATGRGHVGLLAWQGGFELVLVDSNRDLVAALRQAGRYRVKLYGRAGCQEVEVTGFRVYHAAERLAVAAEIVDAALVLTAVFDQNLADVAETLALAVPACRAAGRRPEGAQGAPLNVIACENMMDSSSTLGRHVLSRLSGEELAYAEALFGFPDCMISRVVPRPDPDPLVLVTEDYNEWTARREAFKGEKPPELAALELVDNQTARLERKLFIHNGGHAICGYFGFHRACRYIHQAVADPVVAGHVLGALDEIGQVVRQKHGFSAGSIEAYKQELVQRGAVAEMRDDILRVVRDPVRKLSPRERLVAPALLAEQYGLPRRWLVKGIVAALKYAHPADAPSMALAGRLAAEGLPAVLAEVCQLDPASALAADIQAAWQEWPLS